MTELVLSATEARVLGSLMEKELSTPDYYPMTLNALVNACNQKSNRNPIVNYDEKIVAKTLEDLRFKNLAIRIISSVNRVPKYKHALTSALDLTVQEQAVLCELMLRGPQTFGELKSRTERLYSVSSGDELQAALDLLMSRSEPLIVKLPRQSGHKEQRFAQLLCGLPEIPTDDRPPKLEDATLAVIADNERIALLETALEQVQAEVEALRIEFAEFKRQFE